MKICIYGAGSLGTVLGAFMTQNGVDVELVNRNKQHVEALRENGVEIRGCERFRARVPGCLPATAEDWDTEYLDAILSIRVVDGIEEAMKHIAEHAFLLLLCHNP